MRIKTKKLIAMLMTFVMLLSLMSVPVFAMEDEDVSADEVQTETIIVEEIQDAPVDEFSLIVEEAQEATSAEQIEEQTEEKSEAEDKDTSTGQSEGKTLLGTGIPNGFSSEVGTAEEFATAIATGGEINLAANITYTSTAAITIVGETTIDLSGHTLSIETPSSERFSINVGVYGDSEPTLIIKDSSQDGTGVLNVKNTYTNKVAYIFEVYGTLDIQGGTINQAATKAGSYGIDMCSGGFFKMSGGTIKKGTSIDSGYSLRTSTSSTSTITGGAVEDYYGTTGLQISGGVFKTQPTYEMMKPGYITYKITDEGATKDWYGVKEGTYIGLVGTTVYTDVASFANAIGGNKISVEGTKLTLTDDINLGSASANKVTFLSDITLDLAGHSITGAVAGSSAYMFYVNQKDATVTITDSSEGKTGKVENSTSGYCNTVMVNKGTFVVGGAKIVGKTTGASTTTVITNGSTSSSDPKVVLKNGAVISVENENTAKSSSTGIQNYGICEIDDSAIEVTSGSGATAINPYNSSSVLKIGKNSTGKSTIKAAGTGLNTTQAITMCVIGKGSSGGSGEIYISNADIILTTDKGKSTKAQTCYAVNLGSASNGTYEIGDNVSISASGTCGTTNEVYGLRAEGGGKISGSNVSIDIEGENAKTRYGLYLTNKTNLTIDPGTNVTVEVNKNGYEGGTNYISYASSTGKIAVSGGKYTGGTLNALSLTGGVFDSDPSAFCDEGYVAQENTPSEGLWTVVANTMIRVKNVTQDKEYGKISEAVNEAVSGDELQLMEDVTSSGDLTFNGVNLDLNGHKLALNTLSTSGNVTITDKQATSYENAGTLTASVNVGAGQTTITKCKHVYSTNAYNNKPFIVKSDGEDALANLTINGVKGEYNFNGMSQYFAIATNGNSRVTVGNAEGFITNLKLESAGQNPKLVDGSGENNETVINGGEFYISCSSTTAGVSSAFGSTMKVQVNGGKFKIDSKNADGAKIAGGANADIDLRGGYYAPTDKNGEVAMNDFFANATALAESDYSAKALASDDPLYAEGYRYTVAEIAVAEISGKTYSSLSAAIEAAGADDTVKLLENVTLNEYTLSKNVNFDGNGHSVKLTGNKPLSLAAGVALPECFDVSDALGYIEKKSEERIFYKYWISYGTPNYGLMVDYDTTTDAQIVLTKDMTVGSSLSVYKTCTIDLNGFKIEGINCQYETFNIGASSYGSVVCTVKDSSEGKTGKITGSNEDYYTVCMDTDGDTLILESGTIENTSTNGAGICVMDGYGAAENMTVTINGGLVTTNGGFAIVDNGQYSKNVNININGGKVNSNGGVTIYHPASGTMTLNGGIISGDTAIYIRSGSLVVPKESTVEVRATGTKTSHGSTTGAAYNTGDAIVIDVSDYPGGDPTADIAGGAFYSLHSFAIASYSSCTKNAITGFLKGGIYGANQERIDIMDVTSEKDLIAAGYKDIPNTNEETKNDYPWIIDSTYAVAPTPAIDLTYTGDERTGYTAAGTHVIISGTEKATNAGNYQFKATPEAGYTWKEDGTTDEKTYNWSIAKASLTATAEDKTVTYGDAAPAYTVAYTGWVKGVEEATTAAVLTSTYTAETAVGTLPITFEKAPEFENYTVTTQNGTLTVMPPTGTAMEPVKAENLVYTGEEQNGYTAAGTHVIISGTEKATNAGNYQFKATPETGYTWDDGTANEKTYDWSIAKASVPAPARSDAVTINYAAETTAPKTGYELSTQSGEAFGEGKITEVTDIKFSSPYYIRKAGDANHFASAELTYTPVRPTAPSGFTVKEESIENKKNGTFSGITSSMEYQKNGDEWISGPAVLSGLSDETITVRLKATEEEFKSLVYSYTFTASTEKLTVTIGDAVDHVPYNGLVTRPADPEKEGYTFGGWYRDETCTDAWNFALDTVKDDMTLYPKWIKNEEKKASIGGNVTEEGIGVPEATVELFLGTERVAATVTDANGSYKFDDVKLGTYNIVVTKKDGKTKTELITVNKTGEFGADVKLPTGAVNSKVEHKEGDVVPEAKSNISQTVVGGLDEIAQKETPSGTDKITIKLTVEPKKDEGKPEQQEIKKEAGEGKKIEFLDLSLSKQVNDGTEEDIGSTNDTLLTIVIPFDFKDVSVASMMVLRNHDGNTTKLTRTPNGDGEYFIVNRSAGTITIIAKRFSDYAIVYEVVGAPADDDTTDERQITAYAEPVANATAVSGSWLYKEAEDTWYYIADGSYLKNGWYYLGNPYSKTVKTGWFCFDEAGRMQRGWILSKLGHWFFTHDIKDGDLGRLEKGWHKDDQDGLSYYLDLQTGRMYTGRHVIDGVEYYFTEASVNTSWCQDEKGRWVVTGVIGTPLGSLQK